MDYDQLRQQGLDSQNTMAIREAIKLLTGIDMDEDPATCLQHLNFYIDQQNKMTQTFWDDIPIVVSWDTELNGIPTSITKLLLK